VRLLLVGGVRGHEDEARVEALRRLAGELGLLGPLPAVSSASDTSGTAATFATAPVSTSVELEGVLAPTSDAGAAGDKAEGGDGGGGDAATRPVMGGDHATPQPAVPVSVDGATAVVAPAAGRKGSVGSAPAVEFLVNVPLPRLRQLLGRARVGLHSMWNEHFGISIVEMQAAGVIPIAHNSGGPKLDIVDPGRTGFLAATEAEYASALHRIFSSRSAGGRHGADGDEVDCDAVAAAARESSARFSDEQFSLSLFASLVGPLNDAVDDATAAARAAGTDAVERMVARAAKVGGGSGSGGAAGVRAGSNISDASHED